MDSNPMPVLVVISHYNLRLSQLPVELLDCMWPRRRLHLHDTHRCQFGKN